MPAADAPIIDYQNRYLPTYGKAGMVVSPEKLAGDIGLDMLKQGGNAVDAAVATGLCPGGHATPGRQHRWWWLYADPSGRDR